jgi:zinc transporter 1/2/3
MNDITFKLISIISVLLVGAGGGIFSVKLSESRNSRRLFSLGNAFAAGVFLAAGLLHMLPDANEGFNALSDFPWAYLGCAIGFIMILFLERVILAGHEAVAEALEQHCDAAHKRQLSFHLIVLTLILSVHSIIAGIALGPERSMTHSAIILFAILAHKGSASFALAINLMKERTAGKIVFKIITFFCFMTPIGIVLGILIDKAMTGTAQQIVTASFDSLAAGTFLYVSILGIAHEEFSEQQDKFWKFTLMCIGIAVMAIVAIWT